MPVKVSECLAQATTIHRASKRSKKPNTLVDAGSCPLRCCRAPELATGCALRRLKQRMKLSQRWSVPNLSDVGFNLNGLLVYTLFALTHAVIQTGLTE